MEPSKRVYSSNKPSTNTPVSDKTKETTGATVQYDSFPVLPFGVENRSVGIALPSQNIQSPDRSSSIYPSLTFEGRQVVYQQKDGAAKILDDPKNVEVL